MINKKLLALALLIHSITWGESWYDQKLEGWYYFEDKSPSKQPSSLSQEEAEEILETAKSKLNQLRSLALLVPTESNVENYLKEQKKWIDQSSLFATTWQKVLLSNPLLSDILTNPTSSFGIQERKSIEHQRRQSLLKKLAETHFLLFFFKGSDPFSLKAAEVVQLFASMNNWKVTAVSLDGEPIPSFSQYEIDKGMGAALGVKATPSMYVIDPAGPTAVPVGAGLISVSQLEENIENQFKDPHHAQ